MTSVEAGWLRLTVNLAVSPSVTELEAGPVLKLKDLISYLEHHGV